MQPVLTGPVAGGSSIREGGATATAVRSKSVQLGPVSGLFPVHATGPLNTRPYGECIFFSFIFTDTNACLLHIQLLIYIPRDIETDGRLRLWERAQTTLICAIVDNIEFFSFHIF